MTAKSVLKMPVSAIIPLYLIKCDLESRYLRYSL